MTAWSGSWMLLPPRNRYIRTAVHAVPDFGAQVSVWRRREVASIAAGGR